MNRHLLQRVLRFPQAALKRLVTGLLQLVLLANRPARLAQSGFVLPTTVLLVLMVVLTATALTYRSFTRSDMAISQREQQVISNAATPAIDRAKAKIEFLFQTDKRFPSGLPASDILVDLMLVRTGNTGTTGGLVPPLAGANDPYTLPDETRVDINGDGNLDNAWSFTSDIDGNGSVSPDELVVYSIVVDDQGPGTAATTGVEGMVNQAKARALVTRTGPLATTEASPSCVGARAEGGWQVVQQGDGSTLQKNFQVNAFVANRNNVNRTFETLEFQQSRTAARANKWGAWFRYDLDVTPGPEFNWNGAMHTDGSFYTFAGSGTGAGDGYRSHMVSSQNSCVYSQAASEISLSEIDRDNDKIATPGKVVNGQQEFQGQAVRGAVRVDDTTSGSNSIIHVWNQAGQPAKIDLTLGNTTDSVRTNAGNNDVRPSDVAINPLLLFTRDVTEHINPSAWQRDPAWDNANNADGFKTRKRIINDQVARPFVDDFFRADNRWGPKPLYDSRDTDLSMANVTGAATGNLIVNSTSIATPTVPSKPINVGRLTQETEGLDGYWERQANTAGMKLIVGERLQLGNVNGWNANPIAGSTTFSTANTQGDPLYPAKITPSVNGRYGKSHEYLQRKSLRDNLAAVQGMVVYHYRIPNSADGGKFPAACMAMTAHPGTSQSIINSRTFGTYPVTAAAPRTDFLRGDGTNGWEFQFPAAFSTEATFKAQIADGQPLGIALRNLARFAGDPKGGAPSFRPVQDNDVHPAPYLSMWGDFSPLRRIFTDYLDASPAVAYDNLSPADKVTLHSAACTVSLLAYNVDRDRLELESTITTNNTKLQSVSQQLGKSVQTIMECLEANTSSKASDCKAGNFDSLPFLKTRGDISAGNATVWTDPNPATVITTGNVCPATGANKDAAGFQANCDSAEYFSTWKVADWTAFINIPNVSNSLSDAERTQLIADLTLFAQRINTYYTAIRDRDLGFRQGISTKAGVPYNASAGSFVSWDGTTGLTGSVGGFAQGNKDRVFGIGCDPNIFQTLSAKGGGGADNNVMLGLMACSELNQQPVKYPSLYYLFPVENHDHDGTGYHQQPDGATLPAATQAAEEYITNAYVKSVNPIAGNPSTFRIVGTNAITGINAIAAVPKSTTVSDWRVPASTGTALTDPNTQPFDISIPGGGIKVPFLDKGVYNGREQLNTRVLDIDIEALTTRTTSGGDYWLSADLDRRAEGVVYAFREDAVREDEIVRPKNASGTVTDAFCQTLNTDTPRRFNIETQENCRMRVEPGTTPVFQDPPLTGPPLTGTLVSLKPVDFFADPQRRPHGFRLRTASGSPADLSGTALARKVGMTFVSDNSVYIQGNFNPHSPTGQVTDIIEEFKAPQTLFNKTLAAAFGLPFYNGRTAANLNLDNFANLTKDHWRPVEILADAIIILSGNFKDGALVDGFTLATPGSSGGGTSSYMNQNRPTLGADLALNDWVLESPGSSVWVDRNGTYYRSNAGTPAAIRPFYEVYDTNALWTRFTSSDSDRQKNIQTAATTFVNATFISGLVPQRPLQGYGGLHNFVRFLENWDTIDLHIAGSLIQLNFSTSATGPFEHDAWHPDQDPDNNERLGYYRPPNRRWGYDVALLYVPPAPAARRFVNIGTPRSEYYRELPADDPYIVNLRCAKVGANFVFTDASIRGVCPA